jgi:hypothetical protein
MDRELWRLIMDAIYRAARQIEHIGRRPRYPHCLIAAMYLWSVFHDRCLSWACDRTHYGSIFRPRKLPSISQFTRRVKSDATQQILQHVHQQLISCGIVSLSGYFDAKPLAVSPVSKDPQAARGKITGGYAKGYKLYAFVNERRRVAVWSVMPLNWAEQTVAMELCDHLPLPAAPQQMLFMGDKNYDSGPLHRKLEETLQTPLLVPLRAQGQLRGEQHTARSWRQITPARRDVIRLWQTNPALSRYVLKARNNIEGVFSVMSVALGLDRLPGFVRRLHRVRRWVGAKIILYHARVLAQERLAANV